MRATLICNPQSGRGIDAEGTADKLRALGVDVAEVADAPDEARAEGVDRVVVVGGDGTLAPAAALAAERDVPLAVVPGGTANDFARSLGIPLDQDEAIRLAAECDRTRRLELADMDGRPFVNVASTGLAPAAARHADSFKARLGPLAYPLGAILAGVREEPVACTATVDGRTVYDGRAWQLTVASTGAFGGGAEIEAADPQDGRLDLVVVPGGSRLQLPRRALAMRRGTLAEQDDVIHVRGDVLVVRVPPGTTFNVDGELVEASGETRFAARARTFRLVGP